MLRCSNQSLLRGTRSTFTRKLSGRSTRCQLSSLSVRTAISAPTKPNRKHSRKRVRLVQKIRAQVHRTHRKRQQISHVNALKQDQIAEDQELYQKEMEDRIADGTNAVPLEWEEGMREYWKSQEISDVSQIEQFIRLAQGIPPMLPCEWCDPNSMSLVDNDDWKYTLFLLMKHGRSDLERNLKRCSHLRDGSLTTIHCDRVLECFPMMDSLENALKDNPFLLTLSFTQILRRKLKLIELLSDVLSCDPQTQLRLDRTRFEFEELMKEKQQQKIQNEQNNSHRKNRHRMKHGVNADDDGSALLFDDDRDPSNNILPRILQKGKVDYRIRGHQSGENTLSVSAPASELTDANELVPFSTNLQLFDGLKLYDENNCLNRSEVQTLIDWEDFLSRSLWLLSVDLSDLTIHAFVLRELFNLNHEHCGLMHTDFVSMVERHNWLLKPDTANLLGKWRLLVEYGTGAMVKNKGHIVGPLMDFTQPHLVQFDNDSDSVAINLETESQMEHSSDEETESVALSVTEKKKKTSDLSSKIIDDLSQFDPRVSSGYKIFLTTLFGHVRILRYPWQRIGRIKYWMYNEGSHRTYDLSNVVYSSTRSFYLNSMRVMLHHRYSFDDYHAESRYGGGNPSIFYEANKRKDYEEYLKSELREELSYICSDHMIFEKMTPNMRKLLFSFATSHSDKSTPNGRRKIMSAMLKSNKPRLKALNLFIAHKSWERQQRREMSAGMGIDGSSSGSGQSSEMTIRDMIDAVNAEGDGSDANGSRDDRKKGKSVSSANDRTTIHLSQNIDRTLLAEFESGFVPPKVPFFEGDSHVQLLELLEWLHGEVLLKQYTPSDEDVLSFIQNWNLQWPLKKMEKEWDVSKSASMKRRNKQKEITDLSQVQFASLLDRGRKKGFGVREGRLSKKKKRMGFMPDKEGPRTKY